MGKINTIRKDKKTTEYPRKFMVTVSFDLWASSHEEAAFKFADYLEWALTNGNPKFKEHPYKKPIPSIVVEATEIDPEVSWGCLDNGKEFKVT